MYPALHQKRKIMRPIISLIERIKAVEFWNFYKHWTQFFTRRCSFCIQRVNNLTDIYTEKNPILRFMKKWQQHWTN